MRLSKYIKYVTNFDVAYRSINIKNPHKIPKIKRSSYHFTETNSSQVNVNASALLFKLSSCLSSPKVQIAVDQEAGNLFRGTRNIEKKITYRMSCGGKLTLDFLRFNYANISSRTSVIKAKIKETHKNNLINLQLLDSELSAYRHLSKQTTLSTSKAAALFLVNKKSEDANILISSFIPVVCSGKRGTKFNWYREVLQDSK